MNYPIKLLQKKADEHKLELKKLQGMEPEGMADEEFIRNDIENQQRHIKELNNAINTLIKEWNYSQTKNSSKKTKARKTTQK